MIVLWDVAKLCRQKNKKIVKNLPKQRRMEVWIRKPSGSTGTTPSFNKGQGFRLWLQMEYTGTFDVLKN